MFFENDRQFRLIRFTSSICIRLLRFIEEFLESWRIKLQNSLFMSQQSRDWRIEIIIRESILRKKVKSDDAYNLVGDFCMYMMSGTLNWSRYSNVGCADNLFNHVMSRCHLKFKFAIFHSVSSPQATMAKKNEYLVADKIWPSQVYNLPTERWLHVRNLKWKREQADYPNLSRIDNEMFH